MSEKAITRLCPRCEADVDETLRLRFRCSRCGVTAETRGANPEGWGVLTFAGDIRQRILCLKCFAAVKADVDGAAGEQ